jgi:thioredoxin 1
MRPIGLQKTYYNADTFAALYFKVASYQQALKKANQVIQTAKRESILYTSIT